MASSYGTGCAAAYATNFAQVADVKASSGLVTNACKHARVSPGREISALRSP
ncbi:hypothetical protein [Streptomyces sp. 8N706]|uniref:hypothetical protein n=1 Tax=Streptomyces sp. 8N706 TaxID=3457416 RepID=UPI003FD54EDA